MKYVGLFLHAPIQSWGGQNMADINSGSPKTTETEPTKSAILGLIRSALGVQRGEDDAFGLKDLRVVIRTDSSGTVTRDYAVAQRVHHGFKAGVTKVLPAYYLQEYTFTVLLGHEDEGIIDKIYEALSSPTWAPFLGRRAYVPALPVALGTMVTDDPVNTFESIPVFWSQSEQSNHQKDRKSVRISDSSVDNNSEYLVSFFDDPLSWNMKERHYGEREFSVYYRDYEKSKSATSMSILDHYESIRERFDS